MIDEADLAERAHQRCSVLLRRWLAETHTLVAVGALRLTIGSLRLRTEVVYHSATGVHGFGAIQVLDAAGRLAAMAEPGVLAGACSNAARARAVATAPINNGAGSLVEWVIGALSAGLTDPAGEEADLAVVAELISDRAEARRWLDSHIDAELLPALRALDASREDVEQVTASLLTRRSLAVIGALGCRGVADEATLLELLTRRLRGIAEDYPDTAWLVGHWLTSPTLTEHAAVNGSRLRYLASGTLEAPPVRYEVPNPLRSGLPEVPGVPVPVLDEGWFLRPAEISHPDVTLVHHWMNTGHVAANWGQAWSRAGWRTELANQLGGDHSVPCIVARDGREMAYVELYRVLRDPLSRCYRYHPHDLGVHIAIGEEEATGRGLGSALLRAVAEGLLAADPDCPRVVAEPDVHNAASIAAFRKAGYACEREVGLPGKNSALMVFSRSR